MPYFTENGILVVTYDELVPKFYTSGSLKSTVSRDMKRGYGMKRIVRGHYRSKSLIEYDSLPTAIKEQIADPRKEIHVLEQFFKIHKQIVNDFQSYKFWDGSSIDDRIQQIYIANACVLEAVLKLRELRINDIINKGHRPKRIWEILCNDVQSFRPILKQKYNLDCDLPDNYRRFQEKAERYAEIGFECLIKKTHLNLNAQKVDERTLKILESLFATQGYKPTYIEVTELYNSFLDGYVEIINSETGEAYNPKEFKKLSKSTVYNYLSNWQSKIGTSLFREGNRQRLMQNFKPYHSLTRPKYSGSIISIDDRQPPFEYAKGKRVWFYLGIDLASECYTTWVYGKSKEGIIIDFYRQMVRNYTEWGFQLPAELEAESSLNSSFKTTLLQEGNMFQHVRIEANNARGKRIERYFRELRYGKEKQMKGWIARPFAKNESNQESNSVVPIISYENILSQCLSEIQEWNNSTHSIHNNKTRWEVFCETQNPNLKPTNWRGIIPYLGFKTKTSCNTGIVKLQGKEFLLGEKGSIYTGNNLIQVMQFIEGESVDVYWLDNNEGNILKAYVYKNEKHICELVKKPSYQKARIEQTNEDLQMRKLMSVYVETIEKYAQKRKHSIDKVTIINNHVKTHNNKFKIRDLDNSKQLSLLHETELLEIEEDVSNFNSTIIQPTLKDRF